MVLRGLTNEIVSGPFGEIRKREYAVSRSSEYKVNGGISDRQWYEYIWENDIHETLKRITWDCNSLVRLTDMRRNCDEYELNYEYLCSAKGAVEYFNEKSFFEHCKEEQMSMIDSFISSIIVLHRAGLVHRDITDYNILVDKDRAGRLSLILGDYELVRKIGHENVEVGNEWYSPYEQRESTHLVTTKTDVYTAGVFILQLLGNLVGEYPDQAIWSRSDLVKTSLSNEIKEVLSTAINYMNPDERPDIVEFGNRIFEALFPEVIAKKKIKEPGYTRYSMQSYY